jgi:hypothetical protein
VRTNFRIDLNGVALRFEEAPDDTVALVVSTSHATGYILRFSSVAEMRLFCDALRWLLREV